MLGGTLTLLLCLLMGSVAFAQSARATLDSRQVALGEQVGLTIEVEGGDASPPQLPRIPGLTIQFVGQQTSIKSINFSFSKTLTFNFVVTPQKEGSYTLPSFQIDVDGKTVKTRPLTLQVSRGSSRGNQGDGSTQEAAPDEDVKVEVELDPRRVFVGQQIQQILRVYYAVRTADTIQVSRRPVPGTIDEALNEQGQRKYRKEINDIPYTVEEARWVFYPTEAGSLTVPVMEVTVPVLQQARRGRSVDPFFDPFFSSGMRAVPRGFQTEEQSIQVLPLPDEGKPADFTGLVGRFQVSSQLSSRQVTLGESITQTIVVTGQGNLRNLLLPSLNLPQVKVYDDKPEVEILVDEEGRMISRKTFKRALVPQVSGALELPPLTISYFDPRLERYETSAGKPESITVLPSASGATSLQSVPGTVPGSPGSSPGATVGGKTSPTATPPADDLLPHKTGDVLLATGGAALPGGWTSPLMLGLLLAPPLLFAGVAGVQSVRARGEKDPVKRRRRAAFGIASAGLKGIETKGTAGLDLLSRVMRGYLGDKLGCEGGALTPEEARRLLARAGVSETLANEVAAWLRRVEEARYAPQTREDTLHTFMSEAQALLNRLEQEAALR